MKIIVSPDSFKGSASAKQLCGAVSAGIQKVFPEAEIQAIPLSDGGEGLMGNLVEVCGGQRFSVEVLDPLGRPVKAEYGVIHGDTAVIELAQASGLTLVSETLRNPLLTSTVGTGQLMKHALDQGIRRLVIGLGGSATNDGGAGIMEALGVRLLDSSGKALPRGGGALGRLQQMDVSDLDQRLAEAEIIMASDVSNPLTGSQGASYVFGPQKGASPEMLPVLDEALRHYGSMLEEVFDRPIAALPGTGAAGGTAASLIAFCGAKVVSGIDLFLDLVSFEERLAGADFIVTGEGKLDEQTLSGKVIDGVCKRGHAHNIPVIALCGGLALSSEQLTQLGVAAAFSIVRGPCALDEAVAQALDWAESQAEQLCRIYALRS